MRLIRLYIYRSAVAHYNYAGNVKPKPKTACRARTCLIDAVKTFKNFLRVAFADAYAFIHYFYNGVHGIGVNRNRDCAAFRILNGIVDKNYKQLLHFILIAKYEHLRRVTCSIFQPQPFFGCQRAHFIAYLNGNFR